MRRVEPNGRTLQVGYPIVRWAHGTGFKTNEEGRVIELEFIDNDLRGYLPPETGQSQ